MRQIHIIFFTWFKEMKWHFEGMEQNGISREWNEKKKITYVPSQPPQYIHRVHLSMQMCFNDVFMSVTHTSSECPIGLGPGGLLKAKTEKREVEFTVSTANYWIGVAHLNHRPLPPVPYIIHRYIIWHQMLIEKSSNCFKVSPCKIKHKPQWRPL